MSVIHMEMEQVNNLVNTLTRTVHDFLGLAADMRTSNQSLQYAWQGPSADEFIIEMENVVRRCQVQAEALDTLAGRLRRELAEWEEMDMDFAGVENLGAYLDTFSGKMETVTTRQMRSIFGNSTIAYIHTPFIPIPSKIRLIGVQPINGLGLFGGRAGGQAAGAVPQTALGGSSILRPGSSIGLRRIDGSDNRNPFGGFPWQEGLNPPIPPDRLTDLPGLQPDSPINELGGFTYLDEAFLGKGGLLNNNNINAASGLGAGIGGMGPIAGLELTHGMTIASSLGIEPGIGGMTSASGLVSSVTGQAVRQALGGPVG